VSVFDDSYSTKEDILIDRVCACNFCFLMTCALILKLRVISANEFTGPLPPALSLLTNLTDL
jgi:hypothetical protein